MPSINGRSHQPSQPQHLTLRELRRSMERAIRICAQLEERGCQIQSAHCHTGHIQITIAPPPPDALPTYGYLEPHRGAPTGAEVHCVSVLGNATVEWTR
jgi:hypothetical protein